MKHLLRYILVLKKLLKFFHKLFDKHDHHNPRTLPVLAYEKYARNSIANRGNVMVINSIIILLIASVALIIYKLSRSLGERVELELEK